MLTDIFARRYAGVRLWKDYRSADQALMVQLFAILVEDLAPFARLPEHEFHEFWSTLERRLSRELGQPSLSEPKNLIGQPLPPVAICQNWMTARFGKYETEDIYIKKRLSLIELGFRIREQALAEKERSSRASVEASIARLRGPDAARNAEKIAKMTEADLARETTAFRGAVEELNARLRRMRYPLHYHNGLLQVSEDALIEGQIEQPFWALVAGARWKNVDIDMKEALDRRDTGGRDPAFYAARAIESTIKIISDEKGWTHGKENGAHSYIDNLVSKGNGRFIEVWEANALKAFFTSVRNPLGHGPGGETMPSLTGPQTDWAIAFCMAWVRSLIVRI
jgi:hypothetical protein